VTRIDVFESATAHVDVPTELSPASSSTGAPSEDEPRVPPRAAADGEREAALPTSTTPAAPRAPKDRAPAAERTWPTRSMIGWAVSGVGVAGLGLGLGFGLASMSARDESARHCAGDYCDQTGVALRRDAIERGDIATLTTLAGAAALAGGLVLILTAKDARSEGRPRIDGVRASPSLSPGGGGLLVGGAFR
jgi:hypothetical protein